MSSSSPSPFEPTTAPDSTIPPLISSMLDGRPYRRRADVEAEIARTMARPRDEWTTLCRGPERLSNEAIVFLVRQTVDDDRDLCGRLISHLGRTVAEAAAHWAQGLDPLTTAEIVMQVETEIIELLLAERPSRQSEFLEIALQRALLLCA